MVEPRGGLDFAREALDPEVRGELRIEHLDRDLASELQVIATKDRGHPAPPDLTRDRITAPDASLQASEQTAEGILGGAGRLHHRGAGRARPEPLECLTPQPRD